MRVLRCSFHVQNRSHNQEHRRHDRVGDNVTVGPIAAAAKQSLLRLIPHIMPTDNDQTSLYFLVLDHGDFGIHNMSIAVDVNGQRVVTSLYD